MDSKETESLREAFNKFDKDQSGSIEESEIIQLAKELGHEVTLEEVQAIFREIDTNKDKKISFDEFVIWWSTGRFSSKMAGLVQLQLRLLGYLKATEESLNSVKSVMEEKLPQEKLKNSLQILSMEEESSGKMSLEVSFNLSKNQMEAVQKEKKAFGVSSTSPFQVFRLKAASPEKLVEKIRETIEIGRELSGLGENLERVLGIQVKVEGSFVVIFLSQEGKFAGVLEKSIQNFVGFLPASEEPNSVKVEFNGAIFFKNDLKTLIGMNMKPYQMITDGFKVEVHSEMNANINKAMRKLALSVFEMKAQAGQYIPKEAIDLLIPLLMMRVIRAKLHVDASQVNRIIEDLLGSAFKTLPGIVPLIEEASERIKKPIEAAKAKIPIIEDWLVLLHSENITEIEAGVFHGNFIGKISIKGEGLRELLQKLLV